jgi:hypothetical protein
MSGPFRAAFVELTQLAFDEVKALGEQVVAGILEQAQVRNNQLIAIDQALRVGERLRNVEGLIRMLCTVFGLKLRGVQRAAGDELTWIDVFLECGHKATFVLDEMRLVMIGTPEDVVDYVWSTFCGVPERKCSCVLKERPL